MTRHALRNCNFKMAGKWKECIEDIRVPDTDTRTYRYLELLNQLKVVLISDEEAKKGAAALTVQAGQCIWGRMIYIVQAIQALVEDQSLGGLVTTATTVLSCSSQYRPCLISDHNGPDQYVG